MSHSTPPAPKDEVSSVTPSGAQREQAAQVHLAQQDAVSGFELGTQLADGLFSRLYRAKTTSAEGYEETAAVKLWKPAVKPRSVKPGGAALMGLKHVNVVRHLSEGTTPNGTAYLVMEHARGQTLAGLLKHGPIEVSRAVGISRQLARALVALHGAGLVHGDLKPNHLVIVEDERYEDLIKVCDVGAKPLDWVKANVEEGDWFRRRVYVAPEQLLGDSVTPRSDLYSAGTILFEMLTGSAPTEGEPATQMVARLPRYVPRPLKDVVLRLLQKEPTLRFSSAEQWLTALDQIDGRAQQDEDEHLSSSPRSAFISGAMSRTAPPGSVRPASSLRKAPWGLDAVGFKWWAVACGLAAAGAAGIVGYRMYTHTDPSSVTTAAPLGQTTNAQVAGVHQAPEILALAPEVRSASQWLILSAHFLDGVQQDEAEHSLEQAVRLEPALVNGPDAEQLVARMGARKGTFLARLESDTTLPPAVRLWARKAR